MAKYISVSDDFKDRFLEVYKGKSFSIQLKFEFVGNEKQKELVKVSKIPDQYVYSMNKDLLVMVNEDLYVAFDDESVTILIEQELDKITASIDTGVVKLIKSDLNTFSSLINKYGIDKVGRANKIVDLYNQQKKDGTSEEVKGDFTF